MFYFSYDCESHYEVSLHAEWYISSLTAKENLHIHQRIIQKYNGAQKVSGKRVHETEVQWKVIDDAHEGGKPWKVVAAAKPVGRWVEEKKV